MSLALLSLSGVHRDAVEFEVDPGNNDHFELRIGKGRTKREGVEWIDEVYRTTPLAALPPTGPISGGGTRVAVPRAHIESGPAFVQLFTFKGPGRRSPSYSDVIPIPRVGSEELLVMPRSAVMSRSGTGVRHVGCRTAPQELARTTSLGDLIGQVIEAATPVVAQLIGSSAGGATVGVGSEAGAGAGGAAQTITAILRAIVSGLAGEGNGGNPIGDAAGTTAPAAQGGAERAQTQTLNRFNGGGFSRQQAIPIAALAPLIQAGVTALPEILGPLAQLKNEANQHQLAMRRENNQLVSNIIAGIRQRQMLTDLTDALAGQEGPEAAQLLSLLQLLSAGALPTVPATGSATAQSLTRSMIATDGSASQRAVLTLLHGPKLPWAGGEAVLFNRRTAMRQRVRFDVAPPVPSTSLQRAILTLTVKSREDQRILHTQEQRITGLAPGTEVPIDVAADVVAGLPANQTVDVCAELRWPVTEGRLRRALGSAPVVFVDGFHVAGPGSPVSEERELVDTDANRTFWNKVWESPVLDAPAGSDRKLLWELDVMMRYTVVLTADHDSNGVMETRVLQGQETLESVTARTKGRMKAGVELSIDELARLSNLWSDQPETDPAHVDAFRNAAFARGELREFTRQLQLKGKAAEHGSVWVGPILKLHEFPVATVDETDANGQVVAVTSATARMPLPVAARIIGIVSADDTGSGPIENANGPGYSFEGHEIELFDKVAVNKVVTNAPVRVAS